MSKIALLAGLSPGDTTIMAKDRNNSTGSTVGDFQNRYLWALPL